MKKHIKKVHYHTKKILKAMDKQAHAFMLFLGGLFLIIMATSAQQLMGTHAAINEIQTTTSQIQDITPEEVIGNIKGLGVIKEALVNVVTYFQQIFTSFHDTVIARLEELSNRIKNLEERTSTLENKVNQLHQAPAITTESVGGVGGPSTINNDGGTNTTTTDPNK